MKNISESPRLFLPLDNSGFPFGAISSHYESSRLAVKTFLAQNPCLKRHIALLSHGEVSGRILVVYRDIANSRDLPASSITATVCK